jgi:regulator of nonsense transcripts 2
MNIFKHNQRRIATVKYLGELYNYRMIESALVFDTLYTIVTLGHGMSIAAIATLAM